MIKDNRKQPSLNNKLNGLDKLDPDQVDCFLTDELSVSTTNSSSSSSANDGPVTAKGRSGDANFVVPKTHDMVRSLFDPTLRKSFLECVITFVILSNFAICYWLNKRFDVSFTRKFFLFQYVFWRLAYNLGIGIVLHYQSHYELLTEFAKRHKLFKRRKTHTWLSRSCQFEINTKMPASYDMFSYPEEFNIWLLFRQFVDLILMQDFTTYILYVFLSMPKDILQDMWAFSSKNLRVYLGVAMILFNVWVKIDAHRVVKDYAWYWGDFFFLQDSKLVFDGVFNISPHPMYSIGYMGYYGISLISGDYKVLLVSIMGHLLQFLFLKYVENPHIDRTYGSEDDHTPNGHIDELILKENYNYSRPLISKGLWLTNFDKLRVTDYFTLLTVISLTVFTFFQNPSPMAMFISTLVVKLIGTTVTGTILRKQSTSKWFTRLFLKNGYTQIYCYTQWQFIYNYAITTSYTLLILQTWVQFKSQDKPASYTQIIFGFILCALQMWCNDEILLAISEFGWFYGDFFLTNYIHTRKLTSNGIYRYLSNPERLLGVAGVWGTVLINNFSPQNIGLAIVWTICNFILVKFIEQPHVIKVYGSKKRVGGLQKTLLGFQPLRRFSEIVDRIDPFVATGLLSSDVKPENPIEGDDQRSKNKEQWEDVLNLALQNATSRLSPNCEFKIGDGENDAFSIPETIRISWKLPSNLYHDNDWIGLYKVLETGGDRHKTRVPSNGHWCATNPDAYSRDLFATQAVESFKKTDKYTTGEVHFDSSLLYFEEGVYEFRYHGKNSHAVMLISQPFKLSLPKLQANSSEQLSKDILHFLENANALKDNKFDPRLNKYCTTKSLQQLIKVNTGVEISSEFMRRVSYDIEVISQRTYDIKKVLDSLE